jgi:hypothetical protein
MRMFAGLVLLIAGLVVGTQVYLRDAAFEAPSVIVPAVSPSREREIALVSGPTRVFRNAGAAKIAQQPPLASGPSYETTSAEETLASWETEVTVSPSTQRRMTSSRPGDSSTRYELIRDLQRELKRVGCYWGRIDGSWGSGSKNAMEEFIARVNATLPMKEPDYILLSLVQNHPGRVCGDDCPSGQSIGRGGRCVPNAILAQSKKPPRAARAVATAQDTAKPGAIITMKPAAAIATAEVPQQAPPVPKTVVPASSRALASKNGEVLPWQRKDAASELASNALAGRVVTEQPGRMSIGAPMPRATESAPPPQPITQGAKASAEKLAALGNGESSDSGSIGTVVTPPPTRAARPKRARTASAEPPPKRRRSAKTSFWRPRPGTARYNLMVSLGGGF